MLLYDRGLFSGDFPCLRQNTSHGVNSFPSGCVLCKPPLLASTVNGLYRVVPTHSLMWLDLTSVYKNLYHESTLGNIFFFSSEYDGKFNIDL